MKPSNTLNCALTIAGSDSGGGAGIQADLKAFAAIGVHGTSAITCITAQNPAQVTGIQPIRADMVQRQIEAVFDELPPDAVKTGMLFSTDIIRVVVKFFSTGKRSPLVVDPVMVSTSGARLLKPSAVKAIQLELLPLATIVTPNLDEAEILVGRKLRVPEDLRMAARVIHERFGCAALVKGGHLRGSRDAIDIFFDGKNELLLSAPFVKGISTHGTGCTYSAAIVAHLATGIGLPAAVQRAKEYVTRAIHGSRQVRGHWTLNHDAEQTG
ncbi:MAG TPA: bifunctional hydroxymethylpyrimidine kinase/phosphomethylpyrimidine kinase [Verrucomicrobiota bacterium]|nr:bifunctional hydroxymethylpyrimidine kinase/phosphomethylpyrimidine kinase [Verrucomicrobiota bacterium]